MLVNKYKPKKIEKVVGHLTGIEIINKFIKNYKPGKALLLYGTTGIGKTLIPEIISKEQNLTLTSVHSSELEEIKKIKSSSQMMSLFGKKRIILIDEVDNFSSKNTVTEIISAIKTSKFPIILTANNAYSKKLKTLRNYTEMLQMRRITGYSLIKKLKEITDTEGVEVTDQVLQLIADNANGDLRSAINDLQILSTNRKVIKEADVVGFRERQVSVFDAVKIIFKSNDLKESKKAIMYCDKGLDELFWWVQQNITNEFKDPKQVAQAYEILSKVSVFEYKLKQNTNWRMMKYMSDLLASITLVRGMKDNTYTSYRPPQRMIMLGRSKAQRTEDNEIYSQLGNQLHCSKRSVKTQMPYLNLIMSN